MSKNNISKWSRILQFCELVALVISLGANIYFYYANSQLELSSRRADISILLDSANCTVTKDSVSLKIRGIIRNEGTRASMIREIAVGLSIDIMEATSMQFVYTYSGDIYTSFGWDNSLLEQKETRDLFLSFSIPNRWNLTSLWGGFITVKHDDGKSVQEQTFPIVTS